MNQVFNRYYQRVVIILVCYLLFNGCTNADKNIDYYPNGKIKSIKYYSKKILNGECVWFYNNGFIERKVIYVDGKMNGNSYYFYTSGALKSKRFWSNDKTIGFAAEYWDDTLGILKASILFDRNGTLIHEKDFDQHGYLIHDIGRKTEDTLAE